MTDAGRGGKKPSIPALWEAGADEFFRVQGLPGLHREFQDSQGYSNLVSKNKQKIKHTSKKPNIQTKIGCLLSVLPEKLTSC